MSPQKIKEQADQIRELIVEDNLEEAFELLMSLAENADGDYWDEGLNLNQDFTKLNNETRSGFLTPIQSETNRNRLIDKMLKLTRKIESGNPTPPPPNGKDQVDINKTSNIPDKKDASSANLRTIVFGILGLTVLGVLLFLFLRNPESAPIPKQETDVCAETIEEGKSAFKDGDLDKAERIFIIAKDVCQGIDTPQIWLYRIKVQRERNQENEEETTEERQILPETKIKEKTPEKDIPQEEKNTQKPKEEEIIPVKPSFPTDGINSEDVYKGFLKAGNKAFKNQDYVSAYELYQQAYEIKPKDIVVGGKLETTRNLCYRQFFSKGMDYYNVKDYKNALLEFQKARKYTFNGAQVRGMIRRCEEALN